MNTKSIIFFGLAIASLILAIVSAMNNHNHGVVSGLIGIYGNLILSKVHNKN